jgi:hypothetical protein
MKGYILLSILWCVFIISSCRKQKFENEGIYTGTYISSVDYNDEIKIIKTHTSVSSSDENKNTIRYNGWLFEKHNRKIWGTIPESSIGNTKEVEIELERNLFGTEINGTYTTETLYLNKWRSTTGSITLSL